LHKKYEINININLSNERFISLFDNRIEENLNFNNINYLRDYNRATLLALLSEPQYERVLPPLISDDELEFPPLISDEQILPGLSQLETWSSLPRLTHDEIVRLSLISDNEIVLPAFIEQEFLIPDDAVCGITLEKPECCTPCGHYFCRAEITRWLKKQKKELNKMTCPTCRAEIADVIPDNTNREISFDDVD
jgi:hypothetical protein